jgi:hypothetical protein
MSLLRAILRAQRVGSSKGPWLPGYDNRNGETVTGSPGAGNDYVLRVHVHYGSGASVGEDVYLNGHALSDFGDVRFTAGDKVTELPYFIERRGFFLKGFTKLSNNPLKDLGQGYWLTGFYNTLDDRIYLLFQANAFPSVDISLWSFSPADANNPGSWTNHGVVIHDAAAWEPTHREPHSVIFETQAMADAIDGIRKWRLYYCACQDSDGLSYRVGIARATEADPTTWTRYVGNPVYGPISGEGVADPDAFIKDGKLWMAVGLYNAAMMCNSMHFTVSTNGIAGWVDKREVELFGDKILEEIGGRRET